MADLFFVTEVTDDYRKVDTWKYNMHNVCKILRAMNEKYGWKLEIKDKSVKEEDKDLDWLK
jgi:hypothetical protein